ncbi:septum formation initiator family protein [Nocardioides sp. CFH 31398]|uniref:FtsB family cell division protein n=1 Tax=Nocardioides sp. CFH 31398 TaxID=2919579 RepID=UPI001F060FB7|nr:septum formation initiator family protein [Nocardioides sp. CFH 31398]MCH1865837.1 septum formation initiator family protein [Nocardioides sp. CFH 31398]
MATTAKRPGPAGPGGAARTPRRERPRVTSRGAILALVLAVLVVSYASSLRAYLVQREHIADVKAEIAERQDAITALEREQRRWEDPVYLASQARARFGYLMPGETGFQVLDEDGEPLGAGNGLPETEPEPERPTAWWKTAWESVEIAGRPQQVPEKEPAEQIGPGSGSGR